MRVLRKHLLQHNLLLYRFPGRMQIVLEDNGLLLMVLM